ncbi:MAG: hypothetical protein R3C14_34815 [Caldilineaceae bacterium]
MTHRRDKVGEQAGAQTLARWGWPLLLWLLTIPAILFLLIYGIPQSHDGPIHLLRIARLHDAITRGVLFPRWMPELLLGYGYPTLNYYAAAAYYLVEALRLVGLNLYHAFIAAQWLLLWLAGVGFYLLARDLLPADAGACGAKMASAAPFSLPALVAAVAYIYAPYLLVNLYIRGAIAELGAQMLLPWILWSFQRLWRDAHPQRYLLLATLTLGALAWTHTISLLLIPPLLLAYLGLLWWRAQGQVWARLGWSLGALLGAMGISAFYWLPLLVERTYITDTGLVIARQTLLPASFYTWTNWLDHTWRYLYPANPPYKIGLVQALGALFTVPFALRRSGEMRFWCGVALLCGGLMTAAARPLWFSTDLFLVIQFAWRLLALIQIPLALFWAIPLTYLPRTWWRTGLAGLAMGLLIWSAFPRLPWTTLMAPRSTFAMALNVYFEAGLKEVVAGGKGTSPVQEFRPKWAADTLVLDPATVEANTATEPSPAVAIQTADPLRLTLQVSSTVTTPLRLTSYYFPNWTAMLDSGTRLQPYPSTNLGLLTVDLPAGHHELTVTWTATTVEWVGALLSQVSCLGLALWQWRRQGRQCWWSLAPLGCLALGLVATYSQPAPRPVQPVNAVELTGIQLLGYQTPQVQEDGVNVTLYWLATSTAPPALKTRWQLRRPDGAVVADATFAPYYDAYRSEYWARNTVVDDAYTLPLPPSLVAGAYQVVMTPLQGEGQPGPAIPLGTVTLPHATAPMQPQQIVTASFGDDIVLRGFDLQVAERLGRAPAALVTHPEVKVIDAGQTLVYDLYWQTKRQHNDPYIGFVHLTDHMGQPWVQDDHSPGPPFLPVAIWTTYGLYPDRYWLTVPATAPSGLYWPSVGMYDWHEQERFPVYVPGVAEAGDHYNLPPVKVLNQDIRPSGQRVAYRFGALADLTHYQIQKNGVDWSQATIVGAPGDTLALTTYFRAAAPSAQSLTLFVQVRDGANQMLMQADAEPQQGENPTWSWLSGEVVRNTTTLTIPADAAAGDYMLYMGFYDATDNFTRLPVFDRQSAPLPNQEAPLTTLSVQ